MCHGSVELLVARSSRNAPHKNANRQGLSASTRRFACSSCAFNCIHEERPTLQPFSKRLEDASPEADRQMSPLRERSSFNSFKNARTQYVLDTINDPEGNDPEGNHPEGSNESLVGSEMYLRACTEKRNGALSLWLCSLRRCAPSRGAGHRSGTDCSFLTHALVRAIRSLSRFRLD